MKTAVLDLTFWEELTVKKLLFYEAPSEWIGGQSRKRTFITHIFRQFSIACVKESHSEHTLDLPPISTIFTHYDTHKFLVASVLLVPVQIILFSMRHWIKMIVLSDLCSTRSYIFCEKISHVARKHSACNEIQRLQNFEKMRKLNRRSVNIVLTLSEGLTAQHYKAYQTESSLPIQGWPFCWKLLSVHDIFADLCNSLHFRTYTPSPSSPWPPVLTSTLKSSSPRLLPITALHQLVTESPWLLTALARDHFGIPSFLLSANFCAPPHWLHLYQPDSHTTISANKLSSQPPYQHQISTSPLNLTKSACTALFWPLTAPPPLLGSKQTRLLYISAP